MYLLGPRQAERMIWFTTWDTRKDATEFCGALRSVRATWPRPTQVICVKKDAWVLIGWNKRRAKALVKVLRIQSRRSLARRLW